MFGEISDSSDEDDVQLTKDVYCEKSPLLDNPSTNTIMAQRIQNEAPQTESKKWPQYLAAVVVNIGGFIMGTALGWTAPAGPMMENNQYSFYVSKNNISWIAAFMPLGALFGCPLSAGVINKLGRKSLMLLVTIPTLVGWATIIYAQSVAWICVGRFLTGFSSGFYSVVVPLYTTEIAEKEIRGTLGTYFQLQVNAGILFTYVMGLFFNVFGLSIACAIIPVVYILCLGTLIPESPLFYLMEGKVEKARQALQFFRGPFSNVDPELDVMQKGLARTQQERIPLVKAFQTTPAKRGLFLGLGVMVFQQFTGCNAVIFYATTIFEATSSTMKPNVCTVITGVMAVVSTYISTLVVDKLGRKILLLFSIIAMGLSTFCIGGFFFLSVNYDVTNIAFIPLLALCIFIILFSIGFGPIPWILIGEIFPAQIKGIACSIVCMANWFFVFLVTKLFTELVSVIYIYNTFWLFTAFSVLGTFFVLFAVPETKGKTMEEIQKLLGADHLPPSSENQ